MSGSDRGKRPPAKLAAGAAALLAIGSIAGGIAYGIVEQSTYEQEAEREASDYAKHAAHKISQTCAVAAKAEKPLCLLKANEEYELEKRRSRHDASDLVAQRKSALWAGIMGVAALIGMALSAVGVTLVWITFREQRRATDLAHQEAERARQEAVSSGTNAQAALEVATRNANAAAEQVEVAQNTARSQLRAYISVKSVVMDREIFGEDVDAITLEVVNNGQTPGTIIRVQVSVNWFPSEGDVISFLSHDGPLSFDCHRGTPVTMPMKLVDPAEFPDLPGVMAVAGCVEYKDVFGIKRTVTFAYSSRENVSYWDIEDGERFSATSTLNAEHKEQRRRKLETRSSPP